MIERWTDRASKQTRRAIAVASALGFVAGLFAEHAAGRLPAVAGVGIGLNVLLLLSSVAMVAAGALLAVDLAPDPERTAIEYREEQRVEERLGGGRR